MCLTEAPTWPTRTQTHAPSSELNRRISLLDDRRPLVFHPYHTGDLGRLQILQQNLYSLERCIHIGLYRCQTLPTLLCRWVACTSWSGPFIRIKPCYCVNSLHSFPVSSSIARNFTLFSALTAYSRENCLQRMEHTSLSRLTKKATTRRQETPNHSSEITCKHPRKTNTRRRNQGQDGFAGPSPR